MIKRHRCDIYPILSKIEAQSPKKLEHKEDHDSGNRNIQPDWKSPFGNFTMGTELTREGKQKRTQHQRYHKDRKHDVRNENKEIHRPNKALPGKRSISYKMMVHDITDQEERRSYKGSNHKAHVLSEITCPDFPKAQQQKYRT